MKTYFRSRFAGSRFTDASEILLIVLFAASLVQIGSCLNAGCLLLHAPGSYGGGGTISRVTTNAPFTGAGHVAPTAKSAGFPSSANRG
jgi:hypothetical protein